jgi:hypothetical protein
VVIIYNVTTKVDSSIALQWINWLLQEHIPEVMNTDCFVDHKVLRLLNVDESEGPTYVVQYIAETEDDYNRYIDQFADKLRKRSTEKWKDKFIAFRTVMEDVQ